MIKMIVAIDENFGIGYNGDLLFHIKEDMQYFKEKTLGNSILMGRKTLESLPKLLPYRHHICLTSGKITRLHIPMSVSYITDITGVIEKFKESEEELWVIGGASIYELFLPYADEIYITHIRKSAENVDTYFPFIDMLNLGWVKEEANTIYSVSEDCYLTFAVYRK